MFSKLGLGMNMDASIDDSNVFCNWYMPHLKIRSQSVRSILLMCMLYLLTYQQRCKYVLSILLRIVSGLEGGDAFETTAACLAGLLL
jgi:hypothetical protein